MKTCNTKAVGNSSPAKFLGFQSEVRQLRALVASLGLAFVALGAAAQGTVNFSMTVSGVLSTRVYLPDPDHPFWPLYGNTSGQIPTGTQTYSGALVTGNGFVAQLWTAAGANQPESVLRPAYPITTFRTGAASGIVSPVTVTLTNVPADYPVATVQLRVWEYNYNGQPVPNWPGETTWLDTHGMALGKSLPFNVEAIGGGANLPPNLVNLRSFSLIRNLLDTPVKPLIHAQPQHYNVLPGGIATFSTGSACPAYGPFYWQFNGSNLVSGWTSQGPTTDHFAFPMFANAGGTLTVILSDDFSFSFSQTNVLQITNVQPAQAGIYSLVVTNDCCPLQTPDQKSFAISSNAVLTVGTPGTLTATRDSHSQVVLNWDGVFFLQTATNATGPFTDLPGPMVFGPYTNSEANGSRFFRLRN